MVGSWRGSLAAVGGDSLWRMEVQMAWERVRFVHTSDWRLEEPLGGVGSVPADLRDLFMEAPYQAAAKVVDLAIREKVDFTLLCGNVLTTESACPYTLDFLLTQFERLREQKIGVYWIGASDDDPDLWPAQITLPDNVVTFPVGRATEVVYRRDGSDAAVIVGRSTGSSKSRLSDFAGSSDQLPRIALVHGEYRPRSLEGKGINYWALGGRSRRHLVTEGATTAWYCGSPQGRRPAATGAYGCHVVELEPAQINVRHVPTAAAQWDQQTVNVPRECDLDQLRQLLEQQLKKLPSLEAGLPRLITWTILGANEIHRLLTGQVKQQLIESLRAESKSASTYSLDLDVQPPVLDPELWEEETILGDFLRAVRDLEHDPESWKRLVDSLPEESSLRDPVLDALQRGSADDLRRLWLDVAWLGTEMLGGDTWHEPIGFD